MTQQEFEKVWKNGKEYVECNTSGSTGEPREIKLSKDFMRASAQRTNDFFGIKGSSRLHTCLDFKYIASMMMTVRADLAGCRLTSEVPTSKPLACIAKDESIDLLSMVPAQMEWVLDAKTVWSGIRNILLGGSSIPSLIRRKIELSPYTVWESYGMTETASHIAIRKVDGAESPFKTMDGISVALNDEGCLTINMPDGQILTTTDIAEITGDNEFKILGRADYAVISGGIKIHPEELELRLGPFIAYEYCITSIPDKKWGEKLVLAVEASGLGIGEELLRDAVEVRLRQYRKILELGVKSPKEVIVVSTFPRTSKGKIDRMELKRMLS